MSIAFYFVQILYQNLKIDFRTAPSKGAIWVKFSEKNQHQKKNSTIFSAHLALFRCK